MCPAIVVFPGWFSPTPYNITTDVSSAFGEYSYCSNIGHFKFVAGISIVPATSKPLYFFFLPFVESVPSPSSTPSNLTSFVPLSLESASPSPNESTKSSELFLVIYV